MQSPLILTVSQLNIYAKSVIEQDENLRNVFVTGEISNFVDHYRSGHLYMSIKDSSSSIKAVMFAGNASRLKFKPENGMSVIIRGRVSIYERDGQYQLYIDDMQPDGIGSLSLAFEQLKEKLAKEGLFSQENKKPIPQIPSKIAVISSPTGAAVQDVLNVLGRRFPLSEIIFAGVKVQGESSAEQICAAIEKINSLNAAEVIIIARGGGSAEDLWEFNSEKLAYAIYNSRIPIISGVGHETDYTICDFVADLRAPTPSAAAELSVPDANQQYFYVSSLMNTIVTLVNEKLFDCESTFAKLCESDVLTNPISIVDNCEAYLESLNNELFELADDILNSLSAKFSLLCSALDNLSPLKVLARGYSMTKKDNSIIYSVKNININDNLEIQFCDGLAKAQVLEVLK